MYTPELFKSTDLARIQELIRDYSFATLITPANELHITHVPLLLREDGGKTFLIGHMARANSHWKALEGKESVTIFNGPHTYITPSWYQNVENVPTWNYAVVHAHVKARLILDDAILRQDLEELVKTNEKRYGTSWSMDLLSPEYVGSLSRGIVGFHLEVVRLEPKFKMSQNRAPEDRAGVLEGLLSREDEMSKKVLKWMRHTDTVEE